MPTYEPINADSVQADDETTLFDEFDRLSKQLNLDEKLLSSEKSAEVLDQFLKIDDETKLLIDVKDIQDEISTILLILNDQMDVLEKISLELKTGFSPSLPSISATATTSFDEVRFWEKHQMIANNIRDFQKMEGQAKKTYDALNHLLELKTRQANAWEARFARKGGEEVARQGKTIFWFTVVTIIFLPLSFMASFMALNIKQFPKDNTPGGSGGNLWELGFASSILCKFSLLL
jgi:Mg2+ and Co2+ transporter CorA